MSPALGRRAPPPCHILRDAGLADIDAELEKLSMDSRLAMLISRISRRISNGTVGRPQRRLDFQRQYDLKPERCQRITVSGRTIASASYILGNSRQTPPQYQSVNRDEGRSPGTGSPQHIDLLPQDQNFCLKRNARPQQADHHSKDHSA
jgi:hypothetical protein